MKISMGWRSAWTTQAAALTLCLMTAGCSLQREVYKAGWVPLADLNFERRTAPGRGIQSDSTLLGRILSPTALPKNLSQGIRIPASSPLIDPYELDLNYTQGPGTIRLDKNYGVDLSNVRFPWAQISPSLSQSRSIRLDKVIQSRMGALRDAKAQLLLSTLASPSPNPDSVLWITSTLSADVDDSHHTLVGIDASFYGIEKAGFKLASGDSLNGAGLVIGVEPTMLTSRPTSAFGPIAFDGHQSTERVSVMNPYGGHDWTLTLARTGGLNWSFDVSELPSGMPFYRDSTNHWVPDRVLPYALLGTLSVAAHAQPAPAGRVAEAVIIERLGAGTPSVVPPDSSVTFGGPGVAKQTKVAVIQSNGNGGADVVYVDVLADKGIITLTGRSIHWDARIVGPSHP